jgi:hypothetical protein
MKTEILIGCILAVALLTLVSFSNVVGYNVVKDTQEEIIKDEHEDYPPISLVLQLISKLRNHKDIENVETENDVLEIIESDVELSDIVEELESYRCGCGDETSLGWSFSVICLVLYPTLYVYLFFDLMLHITLPMDIIILIGEIFNCFWA